MTSIDDVIQPGQPIPADVTEISDCDDDTWTLRGERWTCEAMLESSLAPRFKGWSPDQLVTKHGPLTVTAVREQPAEPEPQQADASLLLDLVRQYGCLNPRSMAAADLFARIAALIPQQPDAGGVLDLVRQLRKLVISDSSFIVDEADAMFESVLDRIAAAVYKLEMWLFDVRRERDEALAKRDQIVENSAAWQAQYDEARAEVAHLRVELAATEQMLKVATQTAEPGPLRLTLPEVPDGATLIGNASGNRYTCHLASDGWCSAERGPISLGRLLTVEGGVTVELAPPRELRTWPRIDSAPDSVKSFTGESGQRYVRHLAPNGTPTNLFQPDPAVTLLGERIPAATLSHWAEVDGPLTEVLDGHGATS